MNWPTQSANLNPIEKLWDQVELCLKHKELFKNAIELYKAIEAIWNEITHKEN